MLEAGQRTVQAPKQCTGALSLVLPYRDNFAFFIFFLYIFGCVKAKSIHFAKTNQRIIKKRVFSLEILILFINLFYTQDQKCHH